MTNKILAAFVVGLAVSTSAHAIDAKYRKQLERSGCTQASELQGCDITKTKAENAKAGFGNAAPAAKASAPTQTPYAGQWVAKSVEGKTVSTIRVDAKEHVWVDGKRVNAKRADGGLMFKAGSITYMIQGDRRLRGEDTWTDAKTGSSGKIVTE
jgi:hypothetical protein